MVHSNVFVIFVSVVFFLAVSFVAKFLFFSALINVERVAISAIIAIFCLLLLIY